MKLRTINKYTLCKLLFVIIPFSIFGNINSQKKASLLLKVQKTSECDTNIYFSNANKAISYFKKLNLKKETALVYFHIGRYCIQRNLLHKARINFKESFQLAKKSNNIELRNANEMQLIFISNNLKSNVKREKLRRLLFYSLKLKHFKNVYDIYNRLGILYYEDKLFELSLNAHFKSLYISNKHNLIKEKAIAYLNIASIQLENNQLKSAEINLKNALHFSTIGEEKRTKEAALNSLGLCKKIKGDPKSAIQFYTKLYLSIDKKCYSDEIIYTSVNLLSTYVEINDLKHAKNYIDTIFKYTHYHRPNDVLVKVHYLDGLIEIERGNVNKAISSLDSLKFYLKEKDIESIHYNSLKQNIEKLKNNEFLALKYYSICQAIEIKELKSKDVDKLVELQSEFKNSNYRNKLEKQKLKSTLLIKEKNYQSIRYNLFFVLLFFVFTIVILIVIIINQKKNRKNQSLFSQKLIKNLDDERSRISRDLHDDIGQRLSILMSKLKLYKNGFIEKLDKVDVELQEVIDNTRRISYITHPSILERFSLTDSLKLLLKKTQESSKIACYISVPDNLNNIDKNIQIQLYRILQECVNNTIKHSQAKHLELIIKNQDEFFFLKYFDDGIGVDSKSLNDSVSWLTLKERVHIINGKLQIISSNGNGIQINIKFNSHESISSR